MNLWETRSHTHTHTATSSCWMKSWTAKLSDINWEHRRYILVECIRDEACCTSQLRHVLSITPSMAVSTADDTSSTASVTLAASSDDKTRNNATTSNSCSTNTSTADEQSSYKCLTIQYLHICKPAAHHPCWTDKQTPDRMDALTMLAGQQANMACKKPAPMRYSQQGDPANCGVAREKKTD